MVEVFRPITIMQAPLVVIDSLPPNFSFTGSDPRVEGLGRKALGVVVFRV